MVSPPIREGNNAVPSSCSVYQSRPCALRASYYEKFRGKVRKGGIIKIHHECEDVIENSVPRITDWHHEACRLNISFYIGKT